MNLSLMKNLNGVDLRRVQGFKAEGASYIELLNDFSTYTGNRYATYSVDVNISDFSNQCIILQTDGTPTTSLTSRGVKLWVNSSGKVSFFVYYYNPNVNSCFFGWSSSVTLTTNQSYNIQCVVDAQLKTIDIYIDGVLDSNPTYTEVEPTYFDSFVPYGTITPKIGVQEYNTAFERWFIGMVYNLKFWDYALTTLQLKEEMKGNVLPALGYWPLLYNTKDYSGNGNNGTVTGTEQYEIVERGIKSINNAPVLSKKGFKFNGASFVNTGYSHMQTNNTTIMLWVDPEINGSSAHILSSRDSNITTDYFWFLGVNSSKYFNYTAKYITDINNVYVEQQITELTHVTVVFDSLQVYIYFNGIQQTTVDIINNTQFLQNIAPVGFGASDISSLTNYLTGTMQDIKIFNSTLTEAQIKEEMKGNILPALSYWPLQEDTKDYSNNSNNGTVTGTEQYETIQNGLTDWKDPVLP